MQPNLPAAADLDLHVFEIGLNNVRWLRWAFAHFGIRASLVRAAASNETGRIAVPSALPLGDERQAVRGGVVREDAGAGPVGRNKCLRDKKHRDASSGAVVPTCFQYLPSISLDDYAAQEGLGHMHFISIDTEGHDVRVLQGLERSLKAGAVGVLEFEVGERTLCCHALSCASLPAPPIPPHPSHPTRPTHGRAAGAQRWSMARHQARRRARAARGVHLHLLLAGVPP